MRSFRCSGTLTDMSEDPEDLLDIAATYPADFQYWRDFDSISAYDLILLSLGIEPRTIAELYQLDVMQEEEAETLNLGKQEAEFQRRLATLMNHAANNRLPTVPGAQRTGSPHIRITDFLTWARAQGWSLPAAWIPPGPGTTTNAPTDVMRSPRDEQKARTQQRHESWQREADRRWSANPYLSVTEVARLIARDPSIPGEKNFQTIRRNIRKPEPSR